MDTLNSPRAAAEPPLLDAERLFVQFGGLLAVNNISFRLRGGDLLGLIGPNGSGKTTLLRTVAGLQPATAGRATLLGQPIEPGAIEVLQHVGFTPDTPPAYDTLSVRKFLRFIGMGYNLTDSEITERSDFWLEKLWIAEKADQPVKALSRGMRQRLGIARTLMPNPSLILLDEPAAGLDPAGRVQFRQLLVNLREQGKALIVSSHILSDMAEYCTHIGIMSHGTMLRFGTVAEVAAAADSQRCRYTLLLARPAPSTPHILTAIDSIAIVQAEPAKVTFEYSSDPQDAAALLKRLVQADLPISSFTSHAPGLEEAYLRSGVRQVD